MKKFIIALFSIIMVIVSCSSKNSTLSENTHTINLDYTKGLKKGKLSERFLLEEYIPLESSDESLVGEISKLIVTENRFVIKDDTASSVLIFDKEGRFIKRINSKGRGPNEYLNVEDITVDNEGNIWLMSSLDKLIKYDSDGNYLNAIRTSLMASYIARPSDGRVALYAEQTNNAGKTKINSNLLILDDELNLLTTHFPFKNEAFTYQTFNAFLNNSGDCLIAPRYDDFIYKLDGDDQLEKCYLLDYGNNNQKIADRIVSELKNNKDPKLGATLEYKYNYCALLRALNLKEYMFFIFRKKDRYYYSVYNKTTGSVYQYSADVNEDSIPIPLINDLDSAPYYVFVGNDDDHIYSYTFPDQILDGEALNPHLESVKNRISESENYILTKFRIKP